MYILGDIAYADNYNNEKIKVDKIKVIAELHFQTEKKEFLMQKTY